MTAPVIVILAAGQGTRMRSSTPKLLHPLCGRPMIDWPIAAAAEAGASEVVVVDGPERRLEQVLAGRATLAVQREPRGTADALEAALEQVDATGTVVVMNGDHPLVSAAEIAKLVAAHERQGAAATMATAELEDPSGYGRVVRGPDGTVERVVETKAPGDADELELHIREINTGMYAFDAAAVRPVLAEIGTANVQGERYLPDVLPALRAHERTVLAHTVEDLAVAVGVNDRVGLAKARAIAQQRIHERHMLAGVTIVDPGATVIDVDVEIGRDSVIAPFSSLHGASAIGAESTIGPHTTMIDSRVGSACKVVHSYVVDAELGDRVTVGPFAYLRPGARLRVGAKAGTFVELKNSEIGAGSKVPHLSYIGDTEIGERTNVGAGTITANYDGANKHRTKIGSDAFVGVDTMLVAPVTIGDEAYTGAGSVITEDVPAGALGIARERQRNVEGYTERRRQRAAKSSDAPAAPRASSDREELGSPAAPGQGGLGSPAAPRAPSDRENLGSPAAPGGGEELTPPAGRPGD